MGHDSVSFHVGRCLGGKEYLLYKHEDPSLSPQHPFKKLCTAVHIYNPSAVGGRGRKIVDLLVTTPTSVSVRDPVLREQGRKG